MQRSGQVLIAAEVAAELGVQDVNGAQPVSTAPCLETRRCFPTQSSANSPTDYPLDTTFQENNPWIWNNALPRWKRSKRSRR